MGWGWRWEAQVREGREEALPRLPLAHPFQELGFSFKADGIMTMMDIKLGRIITHCDHGHIFHTHLPTYPRNLFNITNLTVFFSFFVSFSVTNTPSYNQSIWNEARNRNRLRLCCC